jgi:hypothetical protein
VVVNSRIGRGGEQSVWAMWYTVGLDLVVNSWIRRDGKQSNWTWW